MSLFVFPGCRCDLMFSTGDCEDETGRCVCREEYTGENCDRLVIYLTHCGLFMPYGLMNWVTIGSNHGLSPILCQAITWINGDIVNWTFRNKDKWNLNTNTNNFFQENTFQNVGYFAQASKLVSGQLQILDDHKNLYAGQFRFKHAQTAFCVSKHHIAVDALISHLSIHQSHHLCHYIMAFFPTDVTLVTMVTHVVLRASVTSMGHTASSVCQRVVNVHASPTILVIAVTSVLMATLVSLTARVSNVCCLTISGRQHEASMS